ncbi:alpha/beta fold hydrolase [Streptomyces sp. AC536]|uniref:alpha/beta hydrolase family protein n=1 Tax=Streptomyces buecherae TaxID=2763006 RepID=UPI00164D30AF|nr:alpha/beta fold hydrolase [Streptomyces buecherae]QNJ38638.1 alpha/beta fold hydrolase [Streptomyces buecherae]
MRARAFFTREAGAALVLRPSPTPPRAAVVLLHGGREEGLEPPPALNLPGARMVPFARSIARATAEHRVALGSVRYRHRGWNGERDDAAEDAQRALDELVALHGPVPVVLVGHSMGGRAALRAAAAPQVQAVVGLAPWCPEAEPVAHLAGKRVVLLHGERDRITAPGDSRRLTERARRAGADACTLLLPDGEHAMVRRAAAWHSLTTRVVSGLLGLAPLPPVVADALSSATNAAAAVPAPRALHQA